jgi:hypothetical protein
MHMMFAGLSDYYIKYSGNLSKSTGMNNETFLIIIQMFSNFGERFDIDYLRADISVCGMKLRVIDALMCNQSS